MKQLCINSLLSRLLVAGSAARRTRAANRTGLPFPGFLRHCLAVRSVLGFVCVLALPGLQAAAESPNGRANGPEWLQDSQAEDTVSPNARHHSTTSLGRQGKPGVPAMGKIPFIRPIAPMPPMFAKDDLLRMPWSSFGFHRTPVRVHNRAVSAVHWNPVASRANFHATPLEPLASADELSSSADLFHERAMATLSRQHAAASEALASNALPSTGISPVRATQIQAALARYGYLAGAPTGSWDSASVAAMRKLQSDHRWQTKLMPDARALIFLGLGPGSDNP